MKSFYFFIFISIIALTAMLLTEKTGLSGYDWDYQAVIGYGGYQKTIMISNYYCEQSVAEEYPIERTYNNLIRNGLDLYAECLRTIHWSGYDIYCCKR